jgi:hypothetical protein
MTCPEQFDKMGAIYRLLFFDPVLHFTTGAIHPFVEFTAIMFHSL